MAYLEKFQPSDPVKPGEQWFFYWKTSAALWEERLNEIPKEEVVFIPIFWGGHAAANGKWYFENDAPEKDLGRLVKLLHEHDRKFCWLLPLTPAPFLPNGGVPIFSARNLSISEEGVHLACFDQESKLHKIFSFFAPKVWESYSDFLKAFLSFQTRNQVDAPIWGCRFFFYLNEQKCSYFDDRSVIFEQGFSRFLKRNYPKGIELTSPDEENKLKKQFSLEVADLFSIAAQTILSPFWKGIQDIVLLGGSPKDTILRSLSSGNSQINYAKDLQRVFRNSDLPSSVLLFPKEKEEVLSFILKEHFGPQELESRYQLNPADNRIDNQLTQSFGSHWIFDIFTTDMEAEYPEFFQFMSENFKGLYKIHHSFQYTPKWSEAHHNKVKFFLGLDLDEVLFANILKLFMLGQTVILDRFELSDELERKLHIFLSENNIKTQLTRFFTLIQLSQLGEGRLIIFNSKELTQASEGHKFWKHFFDFLNIAHPHISMDSDVVCFWRIRAANPSELSYLNIRRLNLFNPTSYKKNIKIKSPKHFAFMKMVDPLRSKLNSTPEAIEVEILPNGMIALDFGQYQEISWASN